MALIHRGNHVSTQPENVITAELVRILNRMSPRWTLEQHQRPFRGSQKNPDIFITRPGYEPVAIEAKYVDSADDVVAQAQKHVGRELETEYATRTETLHTVMAIRYPAWFKEVAGRDIEEKLCSAADLQYLLKGKSGGETYRFPRKGWATGTVADIANAVHVGTVPSERIDDAAEQMERAVNIAAQQLDAAVKARAAIGDSLEHILHQERGTQTSRMACLIITDAFVFHSSLAGKDLKELAGDNPAASKALAHRKPVQSLGQHLRKMDFADVLTDWETLLKVNYQPIFADAMQMVAAIATDDRLINELLSILCKAANELVKTRLAQIHELAGEVFQKLIVDRKYVKANYTLPTSAALLSTLVCPELPDGRLPKVADFACGTGSLLNGVYKRVQRLYEQQGGKDSADIHKEMLENNLAGSDIMPNATHLTFASLASAQPEIPLGATRVITALYGKQPDDTYAVGALELLERELLLPTMDTEAVQLGGSGNASVEVKRAFQHGEFDIVIQNPPFTRPEADSNRGVRKTVFQGSNRAESDAKAMRAALASGKTRVASGSAGLGSYFVELADRMLKKDGKMGMILPVTCLSSSTWQKVRDMWATEYRDVIVVTIAKALAGDCAFSADSRMAECIVVATKGEGDNTGRAKCVCLHQRPQSALEGLEIGNRILRSDRTHRMEDALNGGNPVKIGDDTVGSCLNCPLPVGEHWTVYRVKSMELIQSAYRLTCGEMLLPRQRAAIEIPMCRLRDIAKTGTRNVASVFNVTKGYTPDGDGYPALWHAKANRQRAIVVAPDSRAILPDVADAKVQRVLDANGRVHYNMWLVFSSNSTLALYTEEPSIGITLITNITFETPRYDIPWALWCNSTLGLLCHWIHSSRSQEWRGRVSLEALRALPTLDVRTLSEEAVSNAEEIFAEMKYQRMLPFNECVRDPVRQHLDAQLLTRVLGITDTTVHAAMQNLREKLCAEPIIHGEKKSLCNLDKELEKLSAQGIVLPGMSAAAQVAAATVQEQEVLDFA